MHWPWLRWLADSPYAGILKIAAGAALGAVLDYLTTSDVSPLVVAISAAVIPVAINALNPADPRYGRGKQRNIIDLATREEFPIMGEN